MAVDIGRIAYEEYVRVQRGEFDLWEHIGKVRQDAWRHAAVAVLQQIDKEKEQSEKGLIG